MISIEDVIEISIRNQKEYDMLNDVRLKDSGVVKLIESKILEGANKGSFYTTIELFSTADDVVGYFERRGYKISKNWKANTIFICW